MTVAIMNGTDTGRFHHWEKFFQTMLVQKDGVLLCPSKHWTKRRAKGGAEPDGNLLQNLPGWHLQHLHKHLIHTREAPWGKGRNEVSLLSFSPMQIEEQGTVLDKNQRRKGSFEDRFCFCCSCLAFGPKINIFPHLLSWIYQEVVNTVSLRIKEESR